MLKKFLYIIFGLITVLTVTMLLAFLLPLFGIIVSPVTNSDTHKKEYLIVEPRAGVCLLYYETEFKIKLVSALVKDLNEKNISIVVDNISNRDSYNPLDYDAVILLSGVKKFAPLPEATQYIRKNKYSYNIIYFVTYKSINVPYGFQLDKKKIDVITSASAVEDNNNNVFEEAKNRIITETMNIIIKY